MILIIIFLIIVIGLNLIPQFSSKHFPKTESFISKILIAYSLGYVFISILEFSGYQLKGAFSYKLLSIIFIAVCIVYFVIVKNTKKKLITVVLLIPLILISFISIILINALYQNSITKQHKIQTNVTGIMSCGESIRLTETSYLLFDKIIYRDDSLCLRGIDKIETIHFDANSGTFLIHHDGEMNSENPLEYTIQNSNYWKIK